MYHLLSLFPSCLRHFPVFRLCPYSLPFGLLYLVGYRSSPFLPSSLPPLPLNLHNLSSSLPIPHHIPLTPRSSRSLSPYHSPALCPSPPPPNTISLLELPNELLLMIAEQILSYRNINAMAQLNRFTHDLLNKSLYSRNNIRKSGSSALICAAKRGQLGTAQRLIKVGQISRPILETCCNALYTSLPPIAALRLPSF